MSHAAATRNDITRNDIDEVLALMRGCMQAVDERFTKVENYIAGLQASHERLLTTIDSFVKRIGDYETEPATRDRQFERLIAWACKVSKKTAIPLENF